MTVQDAIQTISDRLGQRVNLDTDIRRELGMSQTFYESREDLPWFLLTRSQHTVSGANIPLPSGFLAEHQEEPLVRVVYEEKIKPLIKKSMWEVDGLRKGQVGPIYYVLEPTQVVLIPPPEGQIEVELTYFAADTPIGWLPLTGTNKWLTNAPLVLINDAGYRVSMALRSFETAQMFAEQLQMALLAMQKKSFSMLSRSMTLGG